MTDPTEPPPVSEEEARQYVAELRAAPAEQIVVELLSGLLNSAQIKLGRRDARLLIDLSALVVGHARPHLPAELTRQVEQALHQLRLNQVQAENAAAGAATPEPNDLAEIPAPPSAPAAAAPAAPAPAAPAPGRPSAASKLWVPGRDF